MNLNSPLDAQEIDILNESLSKVRTDLEPWLGKHKTLEKSVGTTLSELTREFLAQNHLLVNLHNAP